MTDQYILRQETPSARFYSVCDLRRIGEALRADATDVRICTLGPVNATDDAELIARADDLGVPLNNLFEHDYSDEEAE